MGQTEKFSRIVDYKGTFDVSAILASFNKLKSSLKQRGVSDADLLNLDAEIKKVAELDKAIQKAVQKGFKTPKEFSDFTKMTTQASQAISRLSQNFKRIDANTLSDSLKNASGHTKSLAQQVERLQSAYLKNLKNNIKEVSLRNSIIQKTRENFENLKQGKTVEHDIAETLKQQLLTAKDNYDAKKKELDNEKEKLKVLNEQLNAKKSLKNLEYIQGNTAFQSTFLNKSNYKGLSGEAITNEQFVAVQTTLGSVMSSTKNSIQDLVTALKKQGIVLDDVESKTAIFTATTQQFQERIKSETQSINAQEEAVKKLDEAFKTQEANYKKLASGIGTDENFGKGSLITDYNLIAQSVKKLADAEQVEQNIRNQQQNPIPGLAENIRLQDSFNNSIQEGNEATRQAIRAQSNLDSTFDQISNRFKYLLSFMNAWHVSLRAIRQTFNDIQNIDKAFASIAMVTDMDLSDLWGQYDEYAKIANELGQSTESVIKSSALYYQQGLDTAQSLTLTKDTMKLATLANIDFEQSTKLMTAALRAFHMELDQGAHITDVYSELAANAAANVQDIAYAMSKTSSIAASAGMSFENTAAMLTTMIEVTQEAPENLGTAMKSVIARFTEVKKNVSDIEGDIESIDINKVDTALKSVGVSLKDQAGQIRDLDQVFLELSAKWNDLDRNTQRYVATLAAGSRQQSRFLALMENYDRTIELIEVAQNSAGRSSEQFAKYADSIENKVNRLKNTWEQFRINLIDESVYKKGIDLLNNFISRFTKMDLIDVGVITTWGIVIGKKLINGIIQGVKSVSNLLATGIEEVFLKLKTGRQTRLDIQTNINTVLLPNIQILKEELDRLNEKKQLLIQDIQSAGATSPVIGFVDTLEQELNKLNFTLDETNTEYTFLDLSSGTWQNDLNMQSGVARTTGIDLNALKEKLNSLSGEYIQNAQDIVLVTQRLQEYENQVKKQQKTLAVSKTLSVLGSTIGSAIGTAAMAAFTGTFNLEETTKMIGMQTALTGINTVMSTLPVLITQGAAAFAAAGGPIGLILTAVGALGAVLIPKLIQVWKEHNDIVYQAQKRYEEAEKKVEQLSGKLEKENEILKDLEDSWDKVQKADKTFQELTNKIGLTEEEQQELNQATQDLINEMPELISYYDAEGNAIISINEHYKEQIKLLKEKKLLAEKDAAITNIEEVRAEKKVLDENYNRIDEYFNKNLKLLRYWGFGSSEYENTTINDFFEQLKAGKKNFKLVDIVDKTNNSILQDALVESIKEITGIQLSTDYDKLDEEIELSSEQIKKIETIFKEKFLELIPEINKDITDEDITKYQKYYEELSKLNERTQEGIKTAYNNVLESKLLDYDDSERKNLMKSVFNNILLNDGEIIENYNKEVEKLGHELEGEELTKFITEQVNQTQIDDIRKEVENLSDETYNSAVQYYNELKNLTDKEKAELIKEIREGGAEIVAADMEAQNQQIEKSIQESRKKYLKSRGYTERYDEYGNKRKNNLAPEDLDHALNILQLHSETVFNEVTATAQAMGGKAGDDYIIAMADAISQGNLSVAATMFLEKEIDWSSIDYIHQTEQIAKIAEEMVARQYVKSEEEAIKLINDFIEKNNKGENLGIVTKIKTEADIVSIQENVEKAYELLQGKMDSFTVLYTLEPNAEGAIEVGEEEYQKIRKAIEELNEAEGSPYSFNIAKYFDPDGKTVKNIQRFKEELNAPLQGWAQLDSLLGDLEAKGENLTEEEKALIKPLQTAVGYLKGAYDYQSKFEEEAKKAVTTYKDIASAISSIASDYQSIMDEQDENGFLSSKSLTGLTENVNSLNEKLKDTVLSGQQLDITSILSRNEKGYYANVDALKSWIVHIIALAKASGKFNAELQRELQSILDDLNAYDRKRLEEQQKKAEEERQKQIEELEKAAEDAKKEAEEAADEAKKAQEEVEKAEEALQSAREKVDDIYKDIEEKQQAVIEKQEKLNELLYGTGNRRKSTLDGMYNYDQLLKSIENSLEEVNNVLEHPSLTDNIGGTVAQYGQLMHSKKVNLLGQKQVYEKDLLSSKAVLSAYSQYYTEVNGRLLADVAKLNATATNDDIKDEIENRISAYNDSVDKIHELTISVESLEEEFLNFQRTYRDKYITLQQKVIETLKEQAQEEVNNTKEKYDALAEADNEYVNALEEAIKKQRELREQENSINELSQKEKKLSLLQRDTSGTKKKDILKQQKDVEKSRQSLVDKNVDNLINNLKDLYKTQKESRDAEIKYMETVLENATYIEEANAVISSWQTADDMVQWFYANSTEVTEMTEEQLEQYSEELTELYNAREVYFNTSSEDFSNMLQTQEEEILDVTTSTAEHLTSEAERAFNEVMRQVDEAIAEAKKDLADAMEAVKDAKNQLVDALNEVSNQLKAVEEAHNAAAAAAQKEKEANDAATKAAQEAAAASAAAASAAADAAKKAADASYQTIQEQTKSTYEQTQVPQKKTKEEISSQNKADANHVANQAAQQQQGTNAADTAKSTEKAGATNTTYYKGLNGSIANDTANLYSGYSYEEKKNLEDSLKIKYVHYENGKRGIHSFDNISDLETWVKKQPSGTLTRDSWYHTVAGKTYKYWAYKKGGLVDYTGPAWVDGTPAQPEAFLSAEDTKNIMNFTNILRDLFTTIPLSQAQQISNSSETTINVTVNVDSISDDYDVHDAVQRVKDEIVAAANRVGSTVILHQ